MADIMRVLKHRGFRQLGLVVNKNEHERTDRLRVASFLVNQQYWPAGHRLAPLIQKKPDEQEFCRWLDKNKPDVVIRQHLLLSGWLKSGGWRVPEDISLVGVTVPAGGSYSGHTENIQLLGRTMVDWLADMIRRGEHGVPPTAVQILIPGTLDGGNDIATCRTAAGRERSAKRATLVGQGSNKPAQGSQAVDSHTGRKPGPRQRKAELQSPGLMVVAGFKTDIEPFRRKEKAA